MRKGFRKIYGLLALVALALGLWLAGESGASGAGGDGPLAQDGAGKPRALELYTPHCPSCRRMSDVVEQVNERCAGAGVRIEGLDVSREENEALAERYGVRAVPTFLFFDGNGVETARLVGAQSAEQLERALAGAGLRACGTEV